MNNPHAPAPRPMTYEGHTRDYNDFYIGVKGDCEPCVVVIYDSKKVCLELDEEEYVKASHQALHPPLCIKHALEVGYDFSVAGEFIVSNSRNKLFLQYDDESNVFLDTYCNEYELEDFNWFKPDIYTDAEAVVNAWEGE